MFVVLPRASFAFESKKIHAFAYVLSRTGNHSVWSAVVVLPFAQYDTVWPACEFLFTYFLPSTQNNSVHSMFVVLPRLRSKSV